MLRELKEAIEHGEAVILDISEHSLLVDVSALSPSEYVRYVETDTTVLQTIEHSLSAAHMLSLHQKFNKALIVAHFKKYQKALDMLLEIEEDVIDTNQYLLILHLYEMIAKLNEKLGDYSNSYTYYLNYFTLDKLFPDTDISTNYKMLLQSINFFAKGKSVLEELEQNRKFDYPRFDQALMKAALFEKMGKYKEVSKTLSTATRYLQFNSDIKKALYYHVLIVTIDVVLGINAGTAKSSEELANADLTELPLMYRIKILQTLAVYYLYIQEYRKFFHVLNRMKFQSTKNTVRIEWLRLYSGYLISHFKMEKALSILEIILNIVQETKNELQYLNTKILMMNIQIQIGNYSFLSELDTVFNFEVFLKYNNRVKYVEIVNNYAQVLGMFGKFEKAIEYTDKIVTIARIHNLSVPYAIAKYNLHQLRFIATGDSEELLHMKEVYLELHSILTPYYQEMMLFSYVWYAVALQKTDLFLELSQKIEKISMTLSNPSYQLFYTMIIDCCIKKKQFSADKYYQKVPPKPEMFLFAALFLFSEDAEWIKKGREEMQRHLKTIPEEYREGWLRGNFDANLIEKLHETHFADK